MPLDPHHLPFPVAYPLLHAQNAAESVVTRLENGLFAGYQAMRLIEARRDSTTWPARCMQPQAAVEHVVGHPIGSVHVQLVRRVGEGAGVLTVVRLGSAHADGHFEVAVAPATRMAAYSWRQTSQASRWLNFGRCASGPIPIPKPLAACLRIEVARYEGPFGRPPARD